MVPHLGERVTVNANHARPMMAFWLLAIVAAVITSVGLRAGSTHIQVRAGSPSAVSSSGSPDLLLGGLFRSQPTVAATEPFSHALFGSAAAVEHAAGTVVDAPATKPKHHTKSDSTSEPVTVPTTGTGVVKVRPATSKTQGKSGEHGKTTDTATPTTSTTTRGKGQDKIVATKDPVKGKGH